MHKRSSAWWMRCTCLLYESADLVRRAGGNAMAVSTVLPSMLGNSAKIVSHTIPA